MWLHNGFISSTHEFPRDGSRVSGTYSAEHRHGYGMRFINLANTSLRNVPDGHDTLFPRELLVPGVVCQWLYPVDDEVHKREETV